MSDWEEDHHDHPDIDTMTGWNDDQLEVMMNDASVNLREAIEAYRKITIPKEFQIRLENVIRLAAKNRED